jgi:superfamily II DNA helicase RecQ
MESVFDEASFLNIAIAESLQSKFPEIKSLKPQQVTAITNFLLRRDVFAVLPMGYGKSLIV